MTDEALRLCLERIEGAFPGEVAAVYLFGSQARGTAGLTSDVDFGVLLRHTPHANLSARHFELPGELSRDVGRAVDLVLLNDAPVDLAKRVLSDGRILLERDRALRIRFEVRTRNEYFDLLPYLRRYRAAMLRRASAAR